MKDSKMDLGKVTVTPFERAICMWILHLPGTWTTVPWSQLSHTQEKALHRLVRGGFVEAKFPITLQVKDQSHLIKTLWRVTGSYGPVVKEQVLQYLVSHHNEWIEATMICGDYEEVRLTDEGELAKQECNGTVQVGFRYHGSGRMEDIRKPGIDYETFSLISGGPDGSGGVTPTGGVKFENAVVVPNATSNTTQTPTPTSDKPKTPRFLVAFSFPGERREFIKHVDASLAKRLQPDRIFYDERHRAELARPDLDAYLQSIYHNDTELIVVLLCRDYEQKEWCGLEWRAVRDLIKKRRGPSIMFFRFDDAEIPGVFSIDGYIDANKVTPETAAQFIYERLMQNREHIREKETM